MIEVGEKMVYRDINNPESPVTLEALTRPCDQCSAPIGALCTARDGFHHDLAGRVIHFGRITGE